MDYMFIQVNSEGIAVSTFLKGTLLFLLFFLLALVVMHFIKSMKKDNRVFYENEKAINLRIEQLPDIRIAVKFCKDFKVTVITNKLTISYANPFGELKEFECLLAGNGVKEPFEVHFSETDFKKLCFNLKLGNVAVLKNRVIINNKIVVKSKFNYLRSE